MTDQLKSILLKYTQADHTYLQLCKIEGGYDTWVDMFHDLCVEKFGDLEVSKVGKGSY